ncbi:hypothetical protein IQ266_06695 [filamentous cyanobacterium LEGE 11480]|uniref:Uncharacterized protein n=1 Tax=Romeriopsis navalis LEGE 11480 TaxID=2777977 RepID=A0A928Z3M4_9CYAN|nr:Npun_F0813 family protein [Romeriopsis navalis]MBE9029450.1 hypothetical protein [Romeriopsis navalis LEGE 11480]
MFILKRQDVDITSVQHPTKDQKIPILNYQGMTFRLLNIFPANQQDEARALWRELTDNQGKACVLLEETERYSIWGKVRLEQLVGELSVPKPSKATSGGVVSPVFTQACLLMLQAIYIDVEDLLGAKQSEAFQRDLMQLFKQGQFANTATPDAVIQLLTFDPLNSLQPPPWQEPQLVKLLQDMHHLGKSYFGGNSFNKRVLEALDDLSSYDRTRFLEWLKQSPAATVWL